MTFQEYQNDCMKEPTLLTCLLIRNSGNRYFIVCASTRTSVRTSVLNCQYVFRVEQIELTLIKDHYIEYIVMQESMNMVQENSYSL